MLFNVPLSAAKADRLIQLLNVTGGSRVLDAGCGRGEFLIRLLAATGAEGLGIDIHAESLATARSNAFGRVPKPALEFREADMRQMALPDESFDLAICLGSTHAFGAGDAAYPNALVQLSRLVRPGGQVLIGEGYWKQPPAAEYAQHIGDPVGVYHDHAGNISFAEEQGLVALCALVSNEDEWDEFEWSHRMNFERQAAQSPEDSALAARLTRKRAWCSAFLRWGRDTMGFGFYLFRKPMRAA